MIPLALTLEGLYSYQKRQTIDFNKLTSNHLFGIFGTVGSGKSSILEAITFALYGKTDRLLLSGDNRNYNMMNLKSNLLFIEFDFLAGQNGQEYRIQYTAKRNSKKYHDVKSSPRVFYKKKGSDYIPISESEITDTIGLSYDNFKRTIIIPQGKFQEFLQLKNTERTRMLKELFSLHKYELSPRVKNLEMTNNAHIQKLEGRLEQIGDISEEQVDTLKKQLATVEAALTTLTSLLKEQEQELVALDKLKENVQQLKDLQNKKVILDQQKESITQLKKNLADYEYCIVNFKNTIDTLTLSKQKLQTLRESLNLDSATLNKLQSKHKKIEADFKLLSADFNRIEELKREAEDLKKLVEIKKLERKAEEGSQRLKNGTKTVAKVIDKIEQVKTEDKKEQERLIALKKQLPQIEIINQAQQWHLKKDSIHQSMKDVTSEQSAFIEQLRKLEEEIVHQLKKQALPFSIDNKTLLMDKLNQKLASEERELKQLNDQKEHLLIQSGLEKYAQALKEGEACPLCGSDHHPQPLDSNTISQQIKHLKHKTENLEKTILQTRKLNSYIEQHIAGIKPLEIQLKNIEIKLEKLHKEDTIHQNKVIKPYEDKEILKEAANSYQQIKTQLETCESKLSKLRDCLLAETKKKDHYQIALTDIQRELDKNINSKEVLEGQIPPSLIEKYKDHNDELLIEKAKKLQKKASDINQLFEKTRKQVEDNKNAMAALQGKIDVNERHLESETEQTSKLKEKLQQDMENSDFENIDQIQSMLKLELDMKTSKEKIETYYQNTQRLHHDIQKLTTELNKQTYEAPKHQLAIAKAKETKEKLSEANRQHGKIQSMVSDLSQKLLLQKDLKAQLNKLKLRAADIETLRKLFYKSGFVNYVSSVYLQNLCAAANERFYKMTRQTLSLELSEDNNFEVRDYMNGGKLRSVKTLSGGQTFQAALALALALADNIQHIKQTERNFFFLDEGFGSLDKESLDTVFSTLKNLRKENRIVGVISHVEEMQQEIPTYLNITQNEETGSYIEESWNR